MSCSYPCNCDGKQHHAEHSQPERNNSTESMQCCSVDGNSEQQQQQQQQHGQFQSAPIVSQPQQSNPSDWTDIPTGSLNCPPGLEYLESVDQLLFNQKVEFFAGFEKNVKFDIKNTSGEIVYWASEGNDCFTRCCCGSNRPFDMKVLDGYKREVMHLQRPCTCSGFCGPHFPELLEVSAPPGQVIGKIEEDLNYPQFLIKNSMDDTILRIEGPLCAYPCVGNVEFQVLSLNGAQVGKISKQGLGLSHETSNEADNFSIIFSMNLDVQLKAIIIGACIFIDSMFFERTRHNDCAASN